MNCMGDDITRGQEIQEHETATFMKSRNSK